MIEVGAGEPHRLYTVCPATRLLLTEPHHARTNRAETLPAFSIVALTEAMPT